MTRAERIEAERWEVEGGDCCVVVHDTTTCVAVMGGPYDEATPDDWRRAHLVAAAPAMLAALKKAEAILAVDRQRRAAKGQDDTIGASVLALVRDAIAIASSANWVPPEVANA